MLSGRLDRVLCLSVTQGPRLSRRHPDTGHQECCLDGIHHSHPHFIDQSKSHGHLASRGRKVPSCHLPIRTENRNTWTAAFMPVTSRLTNCPHLSGPRGFLDCRTVTPKPENILGKQNKLFPSYIFFTNTLLYDCTTDYLVAKSWFFSLIPCSWRLRLFPVLCAYKCIV